MRPALRSEGRREALTRLYQSHADSIYRLGLHQCSNPENAHDLVQETFLRAFRNWDSFEGRSKASTWLYTIALRACRRLERRRAGEPARTEAWDDDQNDGSDLHRSSSPSPLDATARSEEVSRVRSALAALEDHHRLPLLLKDLEGLTIQEVSAILGLKPATVKTRLHRGRMALAAVLRSTPRPCTTVHEHGDGSARSCLDLIEARMEAGDRGASFPIPPEVVCERCRSTLQALDRVTDTCALLASEAIEPRVASELIESVRRLAEEQAG